MINFTKLVLSASICLGVSSAFAETIYVTNTNDSGAGSFRQAIVSANADPGATTIQFNIPGAGEHIINEPTALPAFTAPVTINTASTQTGRAVLLGPVINGPGATTGLTFNVGSENSIVQDLIFRNFVFGVVLNTNSVSIMFNTFQDNVGGIDIRLLTGANNTFIRGNSFYSRHGGVYAIEGAGNGVTILGNYLDGESIELHNSQAITVGGFGPPAPNTIVNSDIDAITFNSVNGSSILNNNITTSQGNGIVSHGIDNTIASNKTSGVKGWDILAGDGWFNRVTDNIITGDNSPLYNGILVQNGDAYTVTGNRITGGSLELSSVNSSQRGGVLVSNNFITQDPQGVSAHGALNLTNVTGAVISNNSIQYNASHGINLSGSSNNTIVTNEIFENGRVGVYVYNGTGNKISKNVINNNHADAGGGRTGIFLNAANTNKVAPTITSAKRVGNNFVITGTGTSVNDTVELFYSDWKSKQYVLTQNAFSYAGSVLATGATWTATISAVNHNTGDIYFIATSTDVANNTSMFSNAGAVELNGPTAATTNHPSYYYAEYIPGASYQFWSTLPISSQSVNGNVATFNFNQTGSGYVYVGYTDPTNGQWKMYSLAVTVFGAAKAGTIIPEVSTEVYPNPFTSTTKVKLDGVEDNATLNLYNLNGEMLFTSNGHTNGEEVEVGTNLQPGIYTLQIVAGSTVKTVRIVKAK